ncbi:hypothetical protein SSP531S_24930 [Streptomyces spongiicola]|uniref:Uncharacterized protein n=1 Tax=Streptomyces spongiicola TaxID=1690221 RepID=A0A388SWN1_9ACTN|nr:hypothetical protein [Streptomyces spongiicola]GBQ01063.1 hypothetical protein SSP531S_24930 [Streptomyces spongiicola]
MPNPTSHVTLHERRPAGLGQIDISLAELRGDSARMAPHWVAPPVTPADPVHPSLIHGVVVAPASARLVGSMPGYGD